MSAALSSIPAQLRTRAESIAAHPSSGGYRRVLTTFPVGARFPRRTAAQQSAYLAESRVAATRTAPVFPVGARFPRRTESDALAYLAAQVASLDTAVTAPRRIYPVGARFPRR